MVNILSFMIRNSCGRLSPSCRWNCEYPFKQCCESHSIWNETRP